MIFSLDKIMVALDVDELAEAEEIARALEGSDVTFKIGNQLGTFEGWKAAIDLARAAGVGIFCDTKFKDIPETVKKSARAITRLQPDFFNIMADNSPEALRAAVEGVDSAMNDFNLKIRPKLLGVTVLTSINAEMCQSIYGGNPAEKVLQFATTAAEAGLDGVVCSAAEAELLHSHDATKGLLLVTPGIRPRWAARGDQSRVMTPQKAVEAGADYIVMGRPVTQPPRDIGTPRQALEKIIEELKEGEK